MRKLKLELDALEVDSFTTGSARGVGTVKGRDTTTDCTVTTSGQPNCAENTQFCPRTQAGEYTCLAGCRGTQDPAQTCQQYCYTETFCECPTKYSLDTCCLPCDTQQTGCASLGTGCP